MKKLLPIFLVAVLVVLSACSAPHMTKTGRSAVEEALTCDAIEEALSKADISAYHGKKVYMDYSYLAPQVHKELVMAYMEHLCAGNSMIIVKESAKSDVIFQLFCGVLATDVEKFLIGSPTCPVPIPDTDINIVVPEIPLLMKHTRSAHARFHMTIKDGKTEKPLETITGLNAYSKYVNWVVLLIPFKTHTTGLAHKSGTSSTLSPIDE